MPEHAEPTNEPVIGTDTLLALTSIPTATGREDRVAAWIERWAGEREGVSLSRDPHGNMTLALQNASHDAAPVYATAHLDHPAFVVERVLAPGTLELSFRGGVMKDYFENGRVAVIAGDDSRHPGVLTGEADKSEPSPFPHYLCELDGSGEGATIAVGDVCPWDLPPSEIKDGRLHAPVCDDLAAAAAALEAFDIVRSESLASGEAPPDMRLLFTLAEEVGFVGAIGACRAGTIAKGARVIALENSRAFPEAPIGGGPIVRVGDRISVFSPGLTSAVSAVAQRASGRPSVPKASEKASELGGWPWQRKLMAGGACEASVFCAYGLDATCVCLPLGNYHNMGDLDAVQAGTNTTPARIEPETIAISDYEGMARLLVACSRGLDDTESFMDRLDGLWAERSHLLPGS